jgi:hypothetical protein
MILEILAIGIGCLFIILLVFILLLIVISRSGDIKEHAYAILSNKPGYFTDDYDTLEQVETAIREAGLESADVIFGIDFTKSNIYNGKRSFGGKCLHHIDPNDPDAENPYEFVLKTCAKSIKDYDDDNMYPLYGFGDLTTKDHSVFNLHQHNDECDGYDELLSCYRQSALSIDQPNGIALNGPTSFAPMINKAIDIVKQGKSGKEEYHILVIVADGQISQGCFQDTVNAINKASNHPLSIVMVGVGDGPWDTMETFDDMEEGRRFDNFQFVPFNKIIQEARRTGKNEHDTFALNFLMEIPQQYKAMQKLGLFRKVNKQIYPHSNTYPYQSATAPPASNPYLIKS